MASTGEAWRVTRWSLFTVLAVVAALLTGMNVASSPAATRTIEGRNMVIAGAIRPDADCNWHLIDDEAHHPTGIAGVSVDEAGNVVVHYSERGSAVVTFVATPDETLAAQGYRMGASVDRDQARLRIAPQLRCDEVGPMANVWIYGLMER